MNNKKRLLLILAVMPLCLAAASTARAQAEKISLRQAVALAVQNSRDMALARLGHTVADKSAGVLRSEFRPNLFTGSGAAYTNGFPLDAPTVFNLNYRQTIFDAPLRGELRAAEEQARGRQLDIDRTRDAVILRTASAYLELAKVRHALELLRRERQSAQKILDVTRARAGEGLELPIEVTRAQLTGARVEQRIVQLEGREETLEGQLRDWMGLPPDRRIEVESEDVPLDTQPTAELVAAAMANNPEIQQAESARRGREHRLKGERGGYLPTLDFVGQYGIFSRFNNYDDFYNRFERHNVTVGVQARIPIFSAHTSAAVSLARSELTQAELELRNKRNEVELEVRRKARATREAETGREVARLELQLAQEDLRVVQSQFEEGRASLRDLEKARIEEHNKWMAFLDSDYGRKQAQLELLRTTGQLSRVFQ